VLIYAHPDDVVWGVLYWLMDHLEPKVFIVELHRILGSTLNPPI